MSEQTPDAFDLKAWKTRAIAAEAAVLRYMEIRAADEEQVRLLRAVATAAVEAHRLLVISLREDIVDRGGASMACAELTNALAAYNTLRGAP